MDEKELSLEEWLSLIFSSDKSVVDYVFPTDKHRDEYISTINDRTDNEIRKLLLKLLIHSCSLGSDQLHLASLVAAKNQAPDLFGRMEQMEFTRRLVLFASGKSSSPPWEGITWIIDLLPHFPKQALESLNGYILAHVQLLPDGRLSGLSDAEEIIRAKYIGNPTTQSEKINFLTNISSRDFEHIVEHLYSSMGYETKLTPAQKDGGRDVIAKKESVGALEHIRVECKQYTKPVGVEIARALLGVVSDEKVNKGVLVTTSHFTKGVLDLASRNPRLELISGKQLIPMLNEFLGARWTTQIERIISESYRRNQQLGVLSQKSG
jgi:restriction system protein